MERVGGMMASSVAERGGGGVEESDAERRRVYEYRPNGNVYCVCCIGRCPVSSNDRNMNNPHTLQDMAGRSIVP